MVENNYDRGRYLATLLTDEHLIFPIHLATFG